MYSKLRPNLGKISRPTFSGVCSTDILPILPGPRLDRDYLAHFLAQTRMIEFAASRAAGANLPRLSPTALKEFEIPLPPVEEQRRIAAILNQADAMRTQRRHLLAQMNSLSQSVFMSMFGDPANAGDTVSLGEIASLTGGRNLVAEDLSAETPYRVLKISSVTSGQFRPSESKPLPSNYQPPAAHFVREGDLLMSRANTSELVGAVAYVSQVADNLVLPDKIWRFEWRDTASNPTFYRILLQTPTIRRRISRMSSGTGGSMKNVSKAKLATLRLPAVSPTAQRKFAAHVDRIELQRAKVEHALALEDELFAALQLRAFQGQL
nr:restriction endonuclease subunit S [Curtobacterium pusillum]